MIVIHKNPARRTVCCVVPCSMKSFDFNICKFTGNFIDIEDFQESLEHLDWCPMLDELTLTGNPCSDWEKYKEYTIAKVPQIKRLDGNDIDKSTRLAAK